MPLSPLCRSFMYVPGDKMKMISKIVTAVSSKAPDIAVFDCEDGVGFNSKSVARNNILDIISSGKITECKHSTVCIRINAINTEKLFEDDVKFIVECLKASNYKYPQMINLPKVGEYKDLENFDALLRNSLDYSKIMQPLELSVMIESTFAVANFLQFCQKWIGNTLSCFVPGNVVFGSDDYCATLGVRRTPGNAEILFARQTVANVARAYNIAAIDMVDIDLNDSEALESNCKVGVNLGFLGKQVIHPNQLSVVHKEYSPPSDQVEWADELVSEYKAAQKRGDGVFIFRGQMIDSPTVIQANNIVNRAEAIRNK